MSDGKYQSQSESQHIVEQFLKHGKQLLEDTEKPNVVTYEQFEPYIELFKPDQDRLKSDTVYKQKMMRLSDAYFREIAVNKHQPTIVVVSDTDPTEILHLPRTFTRIASDNTMFSGHRASIPMNVSKASDISKEQLVAQATVNDLMDCNRTPEQLAYFNQIRMTDATLTKWFMDNNLSPEKREALLGTMVTANTDSPTSNSSLTIELDDDDDD